MFMRMYQNPGFKKLIFDLEKSKSEMGPCFLTPHQYVCTWTDQVYGPLTQSWYLKEKLENEMLGAGGGCFFFGALKFLGVRLKMFSIFYELFIMLSRSIRCNIEW